MIDLTYLEEIRLSRALAREIEQIISQYGLCIPQSVHARYLELVEYYQSQMEESVQ